MKKLVSVMAMVLAFAMLTGCSLVTVNTDKITVATVGDRKITKAEFDKGFGEFLSSYGYTAESEEIADQLKDLKEMYLDTMVNDVIRDMKIAELGLGQISQEDKDAAKKGVEDWQAEQKKLLVEMYAADETVTDPEAQADARIAEYLESYGMTLETMAEQELAAIPGNRLYDEVTKDVTVTEDELAAEFEKRAAEEKTSYDGDKSLFVNDYEAGSEVYYMPEGCYYVKHILIGLTEEQKKEISDLRADDDEAVAATADAKRDELLKTIEEKANEVLAKVTAGDDFDALIEQYGEDPGMKNEQFKNGYLTFSGDTGFVAEFADASGKLAADGDTTGLVGTDFGYHIIRRVSTLATKAIALDDVREALNEELLSTKKDELYEAKFEEWKSAIGVDLQLSKL